MDKVQRSVYELKLRNKLLETIGNEFQGFFADLMELSRADFMRVRPWGSVGDRKCDGYLRESKCLFQVYGPPSKRLKELLKKIRGDYDGMLPFWREYVNEWVFVHNWMDGCPADAVVLLSNLGTEGSGPPARDWGPPKIRELVFELSAPSIAKLLGPAPTTKELLNVGMQELRPLLEHVARFPARFDEELPPVPADKVQRNMLSEHVSALLHFGNMRANLVKQYFAQQMDPTRRDEIAASVKSHYQRLRSEGLDPDTIYQRLQHIVSGEYVDLPAMQAGCLAVLSYFFETCDIFEGVVDMRIAG